jgi:peptide/nickel transport system substrate-binding protein
MDLLANPDLEGARKLLQESGYKGEAVIVLQPTDYVIAAKLPVVAAQLLQRAGFRVKLDPIDWNTLLSRVSSKDGWSISLTSANVVSLLSPLDSINFGGAGYPKANYGWPSDARLESLRDAFALAQTEPERKALAEQVQMRIAEIASYVPLGEYRVVPAARRNVKGIVPGWFFTMYWNLEKD